MGWLWDDDKQADDVVGMTKPCERAGGSLGSQEDGVLFFASMCGTADEREMEFAGGDYVRGRVAGCGAERGCGLRLRKRWSREMWGKEEVAP